MMEMGHNSAFRAEQEFGFANENNLVGANLIFYDTEACSDQIRHVPPVSLLTNTTTNPITTLQTLPIVF